MLGRQLAARVSRPLVRLSSSSSVAVPKTIPPAKVLPQAPNYPTTWSTSQAPRPQGTTGPRFEQTAMDLQPLPLSAMEMIAAEPIRVVHGRKAVCDGGMHQTPSSNPYECSRMRGHCAGLGPLGHPKIFINLVSNGFPSCRDLCFDRHAHMHV